MRVAEFHGFKWFDHVINGARHHRLLDLLMGFFPGDDNHGDQPGFFVFLEFLQNGQPSLPGSIKSRRISAGLCCQGQRRRLLSRCRS